MMLLCEAMPGRLLRSGEYSIRGTLDLRGRVVFAGPRTLSSYGSRPEVGVDFRVVSILCPEVEG
jgi:hypothetical protein